MLIKVSLFSCSSFCKKSAKTLFVFFPITSSLKSMLFKTILQLSKYLIVVLLNNKKNDEKINFVYNDKYFSSKLSIKL